MDDTPKLWTFYSLPRRGHPDSREVNVLDLPDWIWLVMKRRQFEEGPDPMLAVDLVVLCAGAGVYPPASVVEWLANRLHEWHEQQGRVDLEVALGIRKKGKGNHTNPFEQAIMTQRNNMVCEVVARLKCLGATVWQAADATSKRFNDGTWNVSSYKVKSLSQQSIVDLWNEHGSKLWGDEVMKQGLKEWEKSPERVAAFLAGFDYEDLPSKVRVRKRPFPT